MICPPSYRLAALALVSVYAFLKADGGVSYEDLATGLGHSSLKVREKAQERLVAQGPASIQFLRETLKATNDPEVSWRCETAIRDILRNERTRGLKDQPEIRNRVNALLKQNPTACVLAGRVLVLDREGNAAKPDGALKQVRVHLTVIDSEVNRLGTGDEPGPPDMWEKKHDATLELEAMPDESGIFCMLVPPGRFDVIGSGTSVFGNAKQPSSLDEKTSRWIAPKIVEARPDDFLLLPDVEFVDRMRTLSLNDGKRYPLGSLPDFRWERFPGAHAHQVNLYRMGGPATLVISTCRVRGDQDRVAWAELQKGIPKYLRLEGEPRSGKYAWSVEALDSKGDRLSGSVLDEKRGSFFLDRD